MFCCNDNSTIRFVRGDTFMFTLYMTSSLDGSIIPFEEGDVLRMTVKHHGSDIPDIFIFMDEVEVNEDGGVVFNIRPSQTRDLSYINRKYDIELTRDNEIYTIVKYADFILTKEVTEYGD